MPNEQPESGTRLSAVQIHDNILESGEKEIERRASSLLFSALAVPSSLFSIAGTAPP